MVALELVEAPAAERKAFAHEQMDPLVEHNGASEDLAFQALRDYLARD